MGAAAGRVPSRAAIVRRPRGADGSHDLSGPLLFAPTVHGDERGFFVETFRESALAELGIAHGFVQDNHSRSRQGIVRGMHFQPGQAKLVRCARGAIVDVVVDIRPGSPQFGEWEAVTLDDVEHRQLYVPEGSPTASASSPRSPT